MIKETHNRSSHRAFRAQLSAGVYREIAHFVYDLTRMITAALQVCGCREEYWVVQFLYQARVSFLRLGIKFHQQQHLRSSVFLTGEIES